MANKLLKWVTGSSLAFNALKRKDQNTLYFIQDTGEIYKGEKSFTESVILVDGFPNTGALGKIYVKKSNLEGKIWTGKIWQTIIQPVVELIEDDKIAEGVATAEAVKAYVIKKFAEQVEDKFVEDITYDKDSKELKYTKGDGEETVAIEGFVTNASYDAGILTFNVQGSRDIKINLPKDNFVESGKYDADAGEIVLTLVDGSEVRIPATDLVDIYTGEETKSAEVNVSEDNVITVDIKVSSESDNALSIKDDGLFVEHTDITGKIDKVDDNKEDEILVATADGNAKASGLKAGQATLITKDENTLATEAAVEAIREALQQNIDEKFDKANIKTIGTLSRDVDTASDEDVLSEKAALTIFKDLYEKKIDKTAIVTKVTEDLDAASEEKVVSEKALVAAMSWTVLTDIQPL